MEIKRTEAAIEAILLPWGICGAFPDCHCGRAGQGYYPQAAASHDGPVSGGGQGDPDHRAGTVLSDVHEKKSIMRT